MTVWLIAVVLLPVLALALLSLTAGRPDHLGVHDGQLATCPSSPNCVSTRAATESQRMEPIRFEGTARQARTRLRQVLQSLPRTEIVADHDNYLHAECSTRVFRFVDDVEFLIDADAHVIHFRSASRAGHSDLGENRRRLMRIVAAFEAASQE